MKQLYKISNSAAVTRNEANSLTTRTLYCGKTNDGRIFLMRDDLIMYGTGSLYEVKSSRIVEGRRKIKLSRTPLLSTFDREPKQESKVRRISCIERKSGKEFRFVGAIELEKGRTDANQFGTGTLPTSYGMQRPCEVQGRLVEELQLVVAARDMGLDPGLKLRQVCALLQESRSSVYRKIAHHIFPPPIKRGKGSFWLLSHIDIYSAGNWPPGIEAPATGRRNASHISNI